MFHTTIDSPENPLALLRKASLNPTAHGNMSDSSLSDSDSESFFTPPSSLEFREDDSNAISKEEIILQSEMLKEAIKNQDKERVLRTLTPLNKWIITLEIWCRENEASFIIY